MYPAVSAEGQQNLWELLRLDHQPLLLEDWRARGREDEAAKKAEEDEAARNAQEDEATKKRKTEDSEEDAEKKRKKEEAEEETRAALLALLEDDAPEEKAQDERASFPQPYVLSGVPLWQPRVAMRELRGFVPQTAASLTEQELEDMIV
jgi:hypothetical protein